MNELINVNYENDRMTVLGRDLHKVLGIDTPYTIWIKRMIEYGFIENEDFITFLLESTGGRPSENHQLTINMAKEICMLQRNEIGKQIRLYFLECEKKLKQQYLPSYQLNDPIDRANKWIEEQKILQNETNKRLIAENRVNEIEGKHTRIWTTREAKILGKHGQQIKQIKKLKIRLENLTGNIIKDNEYTAYEIAKEYKILSINNKPHSAIINDLLLELDSNYRRVWKNNRIDLYEGEYFREIHENVSTGKTVKIYVYTKKSYDYFVNVGIKILLSCNIITKGNTLYTGFKEYKGVSNTFKFKIGM